VVNILLTINAKTTLVFCVHMYVQAYHITSLLYRIKVRFTIILPTDTTCPVRNKVPLLHHTFDYKIGTANMTTSNPSSNVQFHY